MSDFGATGVGTDVWTVYLLLALSIVAVWFPPLRMGSWRLGTWVPVYGVAVGSALLMGVLAPAGLLVLAVLLGMGAIAGQLPTERAALRTGLHLALGLLMMPLAMHVLPGFNNPRLLDSVRISETAPAFTQHLNFDKGSAGLILLAFVAPIATTARAWRTALRQAALVTPPTVIITAFIGLQAGHFALDPKVPPQIVGLLLTQLLFICAAEEAFFRGFVQERLHRALASRGSAVAQWAPSVIATALFAFVHAAGGWQLVLLAALSGTGAAIAYARTRTVEAPILIHFAVNATHLFTLSYPYQR
jgi:membrane protease YdiL (CAAX protease family)